VAIREFAGSDTVTAYLAVCTDSAANPDPVEVITTVHTADGRELRRTRTNYTSDAFVDGALGHTEVLHLSAFPKGQLVLTFEGLQDSSHQRRAFPKRQVSFTVR